MPDDQLLSLVRESGAFKSDDEADRTVIATLDALADCLRPGERRALAEPLSEQYATRLRESHAGEASPMALTDFVETVRRDADVRDPKRKIRVVLTALSEIVGEGEIADARAQLPPEYGDLFKAADLHPGETFVDVVERESDLSEPAARTAVEETLGVLGHRITEGEADDLAAYLAGDAADWLTRTATHDAEDIPPEEFVDEVARSAEVSTDRAREYVQAVADGLVAAVPERERERVEAQLPDRYAAILNLEA